MVHYCLLSGTNKISHHKQLEGYWKNSILYTMHIIFKDTQNHHQINFIKSRLSNLFYFFTVILFPRLDSIRLFFICSFS